MNYFIKRDLNEYGPYSLAELQKYVASGNIVLTDLCRSEGMQDWIPVSQVIGTIPVPQQAPAPSPAAFGAAPATFAQPSPYPPPPSLHWGIVLLLAIVTCGLFAWVWAIIEAVWVQKIQAASKGIVYWGCAIGLQVVYVILSAFFSAFPDSNFKAIALLVQIAGLVLWLVGAFNIKASLEEHFSVAEPLPGGLQLSGVMTFFFSVYYFQYHFSQIIEWKRAQGQIV